MIKLWNRVFWSGKKLNWRHAAGRFHNFSQFHTWNHNQFHLLRQKNRNHSFSQFHVKLTTKKKVRFLPETISRYPNVLRKRLWQWVFSWITYLLYAYRTPNSWIQTLNLKVIGKLFFLTSLFLNNLKSRLKKYK